VYWFELSIGLFSVLVCLNQYSKQTNTENKPILKTKQYSKQSNTQSKPILKTNEYSKQINAQINPILKTVLVCFEHCFVLSIRLF
jgi:hypothetical protein